MKSAANLFLFLTVLFTNIALAFQPQDYIEAVISPNFNPQMKSCYRWMSWVEQRNWTKKGVPYMGRLINSQNFRRYVSNERGIYCFQNPVGSMKGGPGEVYGSYLVRIDLVPDAIFYERGSQAYYQNGELIMDLPDSKKLGIDSEIFYGNYNINHYDWMQEYIIKDLSVIKGFTFNDPELRKELKKYYEKFREGNLAHHEYHMYGNWCLKDFDYGDNIEKKWSCEAYVDLAKDNVESMLSRWRKNKLPQKYYNNPLARK